MCTISAQVLVRRFDFNPCDAGGSARKGVGR
jgi:hypothetical protein